MGQKRSGGKGGGGVEGEAPRKRKNEGYGVDGGDGGNWGKYRYFTEDDK